MSNISREPFWKGFNDGRSGAFYCNLWNSQTARFEYWEGYLAGERRTDLNADGIQYKCESHDCIGLKTREQHDICPKCQAELQAENEKPCEDNDHCGHPHCHRERTCCACDAQLEPQDDYPEYDSARDRDFDRETDAINDARGV